MSNVVQLRPSLAECSRCGGAIQEGARTMTVSVTEEIWHLGQMASVEIVRGWAGLIFCQSCATLYDFKKIGVGRRKTESDLAFERQVDADVFECNREAAAKALGISAAEITADQVEGWRLEQQYNQIVSDEEVHAWIEQNPDLFRNPF